MIIDSFIKWIFYHLQNVHKKVSGEDTFDVYIIYFDINLFLSVIGCSLLYPISFFLGLYSFYLHMCIILVFIILFISFKSLLHKKKYKYIQLKNTSICISLMVMLLFLLILPLLSVIISFFIFPFYFNK